MQLFKKGEQGGEAYYELVTSVLVLATVLVLWALIA
jgi:hypothetical protein